ncbi:MAG: hypothetical protein VZQ62_01105 [Methanosphaera sp.]|nr:hypothetical protein [Methanosphaera sp.]
MTVGELKKALEEFDDNLLILHDETDWGLCELGYPKLDNINNRHLCNVEHKMFIEAKVNDFVIIPLIDIDDPKRKIK